MVKNTSQQRRQRQEIHKKNKKENVKTETNTFKSQDENNFPVESMSFTEELKEVLKHRGKFDP